MSREAGKGDAPRKDADQDKYNEGWERIFGKKKDLPVQEDKRVKEDDDRSAW